MIVLRRLPLVAALMALVSVLTVDIASAQDRRLPLLANERGGPPIARWRVHAKGLERLREARTLPVFAKYTSAAQLNPDERVVLMMVLRGVDLGTAARLLGQQSRLPQLESMLRQEQRAREFKLVGTGPRTRLTSIWPPPGYYVKKKQ